MLFAALVVGGTTFGHAGLAVAAPVTGTGSVSGRVLDALGSPLEGICVGLENGPGAQTDALGEYAIAAIDAGSYHVQFADCRPIPSFVTQWYIDQTSSTSGTSIDVVDAQDTLLDDVTMQPGVTVAGTVTDANGDPLSGINVDVNSVTSSGAGSGGQTAADGTYTTGPLPSGDYRVQFSDPAFGWATQYWYGQATYSSAQVLSLSLDNGPQSAGVDAVLAAAATISGTVTGPLGDPIEGVCVNANIPGDQGVGQATTGADGGYSITGLPPMDLHVQFHDCNPTPAYLDQWYSGASDEASATTITLGEGELRDSVDAAMHVGIAISGTVTDASGAPIVGVDINANPTSAGPSGFAQSGTDGTYTTNVLPPGEYRVQFSSPGSAPAWAQQFWQNQPTWNSATVVTITEADAPARGGIDAVMSAAATIDGTVTDSSGQPLEGICVTAIVQTINGLDGTANATTTADGTYVLGGLAPMATRVAFQDCNHLGPYAQQLWPASRTLGGSHEINLSEGQHVSGIDAQLTSAAVITGVVSDGAHAAVAGICVQATTDGFVGGLTQTDGNGAYTLVLDRPGDYRVQFVDCRGTPEFAGQWWATPPSTAPGTITLAPGDVASGIDAELVPGAVASISGTIHNAHGDAMTTACAVAYLPNQFALFAPVQPDGTYTLLNVPSGTYALAFLGCDHGAPSATVLDPTDATTTYAAVWWRNTALVLDVDLGGGPDPIAQGATQVTVGAGDTLIGFDHCFGCAPEVVTISITGTTRDGESITVAFTTSAPHAQASTPPPAPPLVFTLACTAAGQPTLTATGGRSPLTVTHVVAGATYSCQVTASDGSTTGTSVSFAVEVVAPAAVAPSNGPQPTAPAALVQPVASPTLPRTGSDVVMFVRFAFVMLAAGVFAGAVSSRRRRRTWAQLDARSCR